MSGTVKVDGSSTVAPLTTAAAELFKEEQPGVNVTVGTSGTGGGFEKFCAGETDISDASRPIKDDEEAAICEENGIEYVEMPGRQRRPHRRRQHGERLGRLPHRPSSSRRSGSPAQGQRTLEPGRPDVPGRAAQAVRPRHRLRHLRLLHRRDQRRGGRQPRPTTRRPRTTTSSSRASRATRAASATSASPTTRRTATSSRRVEIDGGDGCVAPSAETAQDGTYTPLSRPLFIYPSNKRGSRSPQVKAFVDSTSRTTREIAEAAQFIPLTDEQKSRRCRQAATALAGVTT